MIVYIYTLLYACKLYISRTPVQYIYLFETTFNKILIDPHYTYILYLYLYTTYYYNSPSNNLLYIYIDYRVLERCYPHENKINLYISHILTKHETKINVLEWKYKISIFILQFYCILYFGKYILPIIII